MANINCILAYLYGTTVPGNYASDGKRCEFFVASKEVTWAGWQPITPHSARRQCYQVAMTTRISRHRGDYEIKSLHSTTAETIVF